MKQLRHIGYFNDEADINNLNGKFYKEKDGDILDFNEIDNKKCEVTHDGKYFVTFPFEEKGVWITDNPNCFIDVYEVIGNDDEYDDGTCPEWCPNCEREVKLPKKLSIYRCPACGFWNVNCNMCYFITKPENDCSLCPLAYEANRRNKLERFIK